MSGFRGALTELIPPLRRYALALTRNRHAADDLVQDALVRAMERQNQFMEGTNLRAWLFTIMHNIFVDQLRKTAPFKENASPVEDGPSPVAHGAQESNFELRELEAALGRLTPDQRSILLLVGLEGLSYEEAAQVTGVAIGTVKSRLFRAREALRQEMARPKAGLQIEAPPQISRPGGLECLLGWRAIS